MNEKTFRYLFILLIFFVILNINIISAENLDQNSNALCNQIITDNGEMEDICSDINSEDIIDSDNQIDSNAIIGNGEENSGNDNAEINNQNTDSTDESDSLNNQSNSSTDNVSMKKTSISSADYVIKSKYLKVYLKDSKKKAIAHEKIFLNINGKTFSATTNNDGMAKFKISEAAKTYKINLRFEGNSEFMPSNNTFNLRVIAKPVYTKLTLAETGIIKNKYLKVYLKTKAGKAISKQKINITIDGKTYTKTTDKNGLAKLKISKKSKIYNITIKYAGKSNYIPTSKKTQINVLNSKIIGKNKYGKVYFLSVIGNRSSKVRIAYVVGLHIREHQIHDSVYKIMKNKVNMNYKYYFYRIVLTKKSGDYSTDRMRGQLLAKNYIVPHAKKQKYNLVIDIHSTTGTSYAKTYFIHVPKNKHKQSMKLAKKTIKEIKSIEKNSKMVYWSPQSQTSPPYIHLPLIKAGTPTFVFETWTYEKKSQTNKRAKILIQAVDRIFG